MKLKCKEEGEEKEEGMHRHHISGKASCYFVQKKGAKAGEKRWKSGVPCWR
jgi:hypothetical protein